MSNKDVKRTTSITYFVRSVKEADKAAKKFREWNRTRGNGFIGFLDLPESKTVHKKKAKKNVMIKKDKNNDINSDEKKKNYKKEEKQSVELSLSTSLLSPSSTVRDLGVVLDSILSLRPQIAAIYRDCLCHLRRIRQLRSALNSALL